MNLQEFIDSLNDLDFENVGSWPVWFKVLAYAATSLAVVFAMYQLVLSESFEILEKKQQEEVSLKKDYEDKSFKAANLSEYKKQMEEMHKNMGAMMKKMQNMHQHMSGKFGMMMKRKVDEKEKNDTHKGHQH